jgi:hypothetical protein
MALKKVRVANTVEGAPCYELQEHPRDDDSENAELSIWWSLRRSIHLPHPPFQNFARKSLIKMRVNQGLKGVSNLFIFTSPIALALPPNGSSEEKLIGKPSISGHGKLIADFLKQRCKLLSLFPALPAAVVIDVLPADYMAGVDYPVPQLSQLVFRVLAFVVRRYPRVDRYPRRIHPGRGKRVINSRRPNPSKIRDSQLGFRPPFFPYIRRVSRVNAPAL